MHELGAWCNNIGVELPFGGAFVFFKINFFFPFIFDVSSSCGIVFSILCRTKSSRSLLIHFGTRCYTIDSEINQLCRADKTDQFVRVLVDILKNFKFAGWLRISVLGMGTRMDDTVHVQIQIVNFRIVFFYFLFNCTF